MKFLDLLQEEFKAVVLAMATTGVNSIRGLATVSRFPYETLRRRLSKLGGIKEKYTRFVLEKDCPWDDVALVVIDPTYLKGLTHGILVAGLLVPNLGRCIPLFWESFNWKEMDHETEGLFSRNLFQRRFVRRLKQLVYPRTLIIIADREFGRSSFFTFLKKAGIYWVVRVPKKGYPPKIGEHIIFQEPGHDEPWLLSHRLPAGYDPVELYFLRMRIEETFKTEGLRSRDAKSLLSMKLILNRIDNAEVKEGLILILFLSWLLLKEASEVAKEQGLLRESIFHLKDKGYYSDISFGRLWLCACAISAFAKPLSHKTLREVEDGPGQTPLQLRTIAHSWVWSLTLVMGIAACSQIRLSVSPKTERHVL